MQSPWHSPHRRAFLSRCGLGLGAAMLGELLRNEVRADARKPDFPPRIDHVIYMHMVGGTSQLDLFDPKPALMQHDGQPCPENLLKGKRFAFINARSALAASPYRFAKFGASGQDVSELLPHFPRIADDVCTIHSMQTDEFNHAPAQLFLHTGFG